MGPSKAVSGSLSSFILISFDNTNIPYYFYWIVLRMWLGLMGKMKIWMASNGMKCGLESTSNTQIEGWKEFVSEFPRINGHNYRLANGQFSPGRKYNEWHYGKTIMVVFAPICKNDDIHHTHTD